MAELAYLVVFLLGLGVGAGVAALAARVILQGERRSAAEKAALLDRAETRLRDAFQALSA